MVVRRLRVGWTLITGAVSKPNRIVVFDVSGVINITDRIVFSKNLYVAGQTAPGEGITVYGNGVSFSGASNIIYGRLIAKGMGNSSDGSQLLLNSGFTGFPNNAVTLKGNTRVVLWNSSGAKVKIGGLSGDKGTYLSGVTKNTDNAKITWIVGSANTDEVFNGAIDEQCSARGHYAQTSIEKVGTGDWTLNGNCSYSGTTLVSGGRPYSGQPCACGQRGRPSAHLRLLGQKSGSSHWSIHTQRQEIYEVNHSVASLLYQPAS